jgi:hypothetical protein
MTVVVHVPQTVEYTFKVKTDTGERTMRGLRTEMVAVVQKMMRVEGKLTLWDMQAGKAVPFEGRSFAVLTAAFSGDGKKLLTWSGEHLRLWDVGSRTRMRQLTLPQGTQLGPLVLSPDGRLALVREMAPLGGGPVLPGAPLPPPKKMPAEPLKEKEKLPVQARYEAARQGEWDLVVFEDADEKKAPKPDGKPEPAEPKQPAEPPEPDLPPLGGAFQLWDLQTGRMLRRFAGHQDAVTSLAFAPKGRYVLSGSLDGTIRLWVFPEPESLRPPEPGPRLQDRPFLAPTSPDTLPKGEPVPIPKNGKEAT